MRSAALILSILATISSSAMARNDRSGMYIELDGGIADFSDNEIDREDVSFEDSWSGSARIGFAEKRVGLEFELGLHSGQGTGQSGEEIDAMILSLMLNVIYRFVRLGPVDWYAGGGIGFSRSINGEGDFGGGDLSEDSLFNNTLQTEAGLVIELSNGLNVVPHVRSMAILSNSDEDQVIYSARLGIRWSGRRR